MKDTSWEKVADWYDTHLSADNTYHATVVIPNLLRVLDIKKGDTVLDLACGAGVLGVELAARGATVFGVDASPALVARAAFRVPEGTFFVSPSDSLGRIASGSIDTIACVLAIQNIQKVKETFIECKRVLKPDGRLCIVMNHPVVRIPKGSSWGWDETANAQYRRLDYYLSEKTISIDAHPGASARGEKSSDTISFHRALQYYFKLLGNEGFGVSRLEEWISNKTSEAGPRKTEEDRTRKEFPLFLMLEAKLF